MRLAKLTSILGGAAALFQLGMAAPMDVFQSLNTRGSTYSQYCSTDDLNGINAAVLEAKTMLGIASTRTQQLGQWLEAVKSGAASAANFNNEPAYFRSTAKTFESIFGFVYFGPQHTTQNDAALLRVKFIYDFIGNFTQGLDTFWNNGNFEIYCSDSWLTNTANQYMYWDARTTTKNPTIRDFTASSGICRDVPTYYGWVDPEIQNDATSTQRTSILTLCQGYISKWTNNYLSGNTLASIWGAAFNTGSTSLDAFQGSTYTSGLLHELSHAAEVVGDRYLVDKACTVAGSTGSAYGWQCISDLAQKSPEDAIGNADSWTYYITAMAFELNDWSTGVSNPVI
ncbi:hypothetical protein N7528_006675 [Penicillium herquei]|nr:hypothetical protein N7528_006675 [Penicillium herquei]